MAFSINTNVGAMVALQNLNITGKSLEKTQLNVISGLRINGPKDDGATFAIAQNMRGEIAGMRAVKTALATGDSTVGVAVTAGQAITDLLTEMKSKIVQANQAGLDAASRTALNNDFTELRSQLDTIVATASFNGTNMIQSTSTTLNVLSTVDGSTIAVSAQNMSSTGLAIQSASLLTSANAQSALTLIDSAITSVSSKLASLGSSANRLDVQSEFTTKLIDILRVGVGNLVDSDLAEESAQLQALQIKQQLGVQALSIANAAPQAVLGLF